MNGEASFQHASHSLSPPDVDVLTMHSGANFALTASPTMAG